MRFGSVLFGSVWLEYRSFGIRYIRYLPASVVHCSAVVQWAVPLGKYSKYVDFRLWEKHAATLSCTFFGFLPLCGQTDYCIFSLYCPMSIEQFLNTLCTRTQYIWKSSLSENSKLDLKNCPLCKRRHVFLVDLSKKIISKLNFGLFKGIKNLLPWICKQLYWVVFHY